MGWTPLAVLRSAALFLLAGLGEIGGGWLVWQAVRERKPWWWAALGGACLVAYGFVPTLQPAAAGDEFGRIDAAYGGMFIGMSFAWGRALDGMRLDLGDLIGGCLCLAGVVVILAWPRAPGAARMGCGCADGANASARCHGVVHSSAAALENCTSSTVLTATGD
jgi:small multidrug resistance family-3 protein